MAGKQRSVMTDLGAVAPNSVGKDAFWDGLISARSGISRITRFDASQFPCQIAGEVADFEPTSYLLPERRDLPRIGLFAESRARLANPKALSTTACTASPTLTLRSEWPTRVSNLLNEVDMLVDASHNPQVIQALRGKRLRIHGVSSCSSNACGRIPEHSPGGHSGVRNMGRMRAEYGIISRIVQLILFLVFFPPWPGSVSHADDALVLPKGAWRVPLEVDIYFSIRERFDPKGNVEPIAVDYNRSLDTRAFPLLAPLDPILGGRASLGDSTVSFAYDLTILELGLQYGVTDRLTLGTRIPYRWWRNNVKASLNSAPGSSANVGLNPRFGAPGQPPLIPLARGGVRLTTDDVQQLLGPGLPGIPGFGYRRVESESHDGVGDMEAGFRYQYFKTGDWRLAFTGGARFPTGRADDPDDLVDLADGRGAYALLFRVNNDFTLSNLWWGTPEATVKGAPGALAPGELVLNYTFRYDLVLPDHEVKRVPDTVNNPITTNKENVRRDLGDVFEFEGSARYGLFKGLLFSPLYRYGFKLQDRISGTKGFAYSSLEQETAYTEHIFIVRLAYTTLPLYREKKFLLPLTGSVSYRNRFAGSNNILKAEYLSVRLEVFF